MALLLPALDGYMLSIWQLIIVCEHICDIIFPFLSEIFKFVGHYLGTDLADFCESVSRCCSENTNQRILKVSCSLCLPGCYFDPSGATLIRAKILSGLLLLCVDVSPP